MLELPRVFFWIELGGLLFSLLTLWPSYAAQMLVWRFTPRKKWIDTKVRHKKADRCHDAERSGRIRAARAEGRGAAGIVGRSRRRSRIRVSAVALTHSPPLRRTHLCAALCCAALPCVAQVHILRVGFIGLLIETIRCPDMSAGFGLMSSMTQRLLYQQLGAILLSAVVLVMLATARSLYVQMSRPVPAVFVRLMWGVVVINQLFVIPVLVTTT